MHTTSGSCTKENGRKGMGRMAGIRWRGRDFRGLLTTEEKRLYRRIFEKIDYIYDASFAFEHTEEELFGEGSHVDVPEWTYFTEVAEEVPSHGGKRTVLSPRDEAKMFLRYNYARYRLSKLLEAQRKRQTPARAKQMVHWFRGALKDQARLVQANMALVLAMAKRWRNPNVEFGELVSEGNMALLRSVEKFDVSRGYKFSTYACRAILKSFKRLSAKTYRYRQHFPTEFDPELERSDFGDQRHKMQRENSLDGLREILARNSAKLSNVERTIVRERFAIRSRSKGRTLAEVAKMVGLTNERVRQIQNLALGKIRVVLDEQFLTP
jgi:RNA polymerase primary sigma factor